jgi:hypothetical protein
MVREHMCALFGEERADALRTELEPLGPAAREATIVNALAQSLKAFGHRYVLPFCFKNESGTRTKHHLIFVTKAFKGYEVMKDIMAKASSSREQGVPSFAYSSAESPGTPGIVGASRSYSLSCLLDGVGRVVGAGHMPALDKGRG